MDDTLAVMTRDLVKRYGRVRALRGVTLEVRRGELFGFLGPNGAGKTTTIRCLLDLIRPQGGTIRVLGRDPQEEPVEVRARVGYLPGELHLKEGLTAREALRYYGRLRRNQVDWGFVSELSERLELNLNRPIKNLSSGNKQKVGVIQALMARPPLLLLDEPTSGLDPLMQQEVYRLLREAQADGATVFFSSHIISEVEALAERVAIIRRGVIVEEADPDQLMAMALRRLHLRFREPVDPDALTELAGVTLLSTDGESITLEVEGEMEELIRTLGRYPVIDLETEHRSLEEVFLEYYKGEEANERVR